MTLPAPAAVLISAPVPRTAITAALWILASSAIFAVIFAIPKWAGAPMPWLQVAFLRFALGFVGVLIVIAIRGVRLSLPRPRQAGRHVLRSAMAVGSLFLAILSIGLLPVADATAIQMSKGAFALLAAALFLGERVGPRRWMAALICIVGAVVVARPGALFSQTLDSNLLLGVLTAAGSAICMGGESAMIRAQVLEERPLAVLLWVNGGATLWLAGPALLNWQWPGWQAAWPILLMGPLALVGQGCNLRGFSQAETSWLTPFSYSGMIFSALLGLFVFHEAVGWHTLVGAVLIAAGGMAVTRRH
jgi:drug/metabolite transporter (DMT)-like permease